MWNFASRVSRMSSVGPPLDRGADRKTHWWFWTSYLSSTKHWQPRFFQYSTIFIGEILAYAGLADLSWGIQSLTNFLQIDVNRIWPFAVLHFAGIGAKTARTRCDPQSSAQFWWFCLEDHSTGVTPCVLGRRVAICITCEVDYVARKRWYISTWWSPVNLWGICRSQNIISCW